MTSERPAPPPLPFRFAWVWIIVFILLGLSVKPTFRIVKSWRAEIMLHSAEKAFKKGDFIRAKEYSLISLQLLPFQIKPIRILAKIAEMQRDPSALTLWIHIVKSREVTDEDRLTLGEAALRENLLLETEDQVNILVNRVPPSKEALNLAGLLAVRQQKFIQAKQYLEEAIRLDPNYVRAYLNLARVELTLSHNRESTSHGLEILKNLSDRQDEMALESLRLWAEWGRDHSAILPYDHKIAERLKSHPSSQMMDRCVIADWEMQTFPKKREVIIQNLTESTSINTLKPTEKRDLAAWLSRYRMFEKTLKLFPLDPKAPEDLILVQLDAMAALEKWKELNDFFSNDTPHLQPMLRSLFQARIAQELGNQKLFEYTWRQATREAGTNPKAVQYLAIYADNRGDIERSTECYEKLTQFGSYQLSALLSLLRLYEKSGQTKDLFRTLQRLSQLRPNDSAVINDLAYVGLLLNETSTQPFDHAREIYALQPEMPPFAATYALSQLKAGLPAVALKAIETIGPSKLVAPGWQAIYAATLAANGKKSEAVRVAQKINLDQLKAEERELISSFYPVPK
jgi:tetratricopeptide (TPR) repeat protein